MKHGIKNFSNPKQGGRTRQGCLQGEWFVKSILDELGITTLKIKFSPKNKSIKLHMTPDFIIKKYDANYHILLESKYKQIAGSDWEKLESNFGFHEFYYNKICGIKCKTVVILSGYWRQCQKNLYEVFLKYMKNKYGENCIFDFGDNVSEIVRFAKFMNTPIDANLTQRIKTRWKDEKDN